MFSPDNFYQYLLLNLKDRNIDTELYYFPNPGIRTLDGINTFGHRAPMMPPRYASRCFLSDQEPLDINFYTNWKFDDLSKAFNPQGATFAKHLPSMDFASYFFSGTHTPILCHSEKNSQDVNIFKDHFFSDAHYFYHGLISRDWYRHWKYYNISRNASAMRFGLYARDASGSRSYRLSLLEKLVPIKQQVYYKLQPEIANDLCLEVRRQWPANPEIKGAAASAIIDLNDSEQFHIHLVAETLFNTSKTHLTEKVFKPMVMKQPFIIIGPPGSLEYLHTYGFQSFGDIWDESYDQETDSEKRMDKILSTVKHLASMNEYQFIDIVNKANTIVNFNHQHFYSQRFEDILMNELHNNLDSAIAETHERFFRMPGGNWFYYQDMLIKDGHKLPNPTQQINHQVINYLKQHKGDPVAKQILSKYAHLF
jgi:hypothetical protein